MWSWPLSKMFGCIGVFQSTNLPRKANVFYWLGEFLDEDFTKPQAGPIVLFESVGGKEV